MFNKGKWVVINLQLAPRTIWCQIVCIFFTMQLVSSLVIFGSGVLGIGMSYELEFLIINGFVSILRNCNGSVVL